MQVHITGRHVEITEGIREHIYAKADRSLSGLSRIQDVQVVLELQKRMHTAEVVIKGKNLHVEAESTSQNMYTSIDEAIEKAERQLRKLREKVQDHH
ncbi:ribosome hibernation-promoting factor, HPF/YfiA family [Tichowtungia aerotolerans]|uniref:Ribosome hibernation promoting factor n=1 Tax=Tichowtungia aerotolerans TaxID=2697043 RepID=A0A6P1MCF6_9BACT|nr:ribosome-associated translation inhibitor RaiA [Tichowtungia aerotolerans]QHI70254.1 ribosome-associated translation inhibitor RaiA [Tichowtungia aerotolerans]